ncbi:MAG: TlyA family RNA methyltransferase [Anaerolinea sp.]|nr:TlyA family RNA methyltransferase [Anaerolinea sp.]
MKTAPKERLDVLLVERGSADSREAARRLIMAGEVRVNGQVVSKPGQRVSVNAPISLRAAPRFVSRGGEKLDAALSAFGLSVEGLVCADVGASTGGFTDCLLQRGAHKVYAIDVGYGQLDYRLRGDSRVVVMERVNARYLESLPEKVSFVCLDASFIPLKLLLPAVIGWLQEQAEVIPLIKPQFEAGRADVGKNGVVRSAEVHARVLHEVLNFAHESGFGVGGLVRSPLKGPAGNAEFLAWLTWGQGKGINFEPLIPGVLEASALELPPIRSETEDQTENQS